MGSSKTRRVLCGHGGNCGKTAVVWRYVPFVTVRHGGMLAAYCAKHVAEADSLGAREIVVFPYLPTKPAAKGAPKT